MGFKSDKQRRGLFGHNGRGSFPELQDHEKYMNNQRETIAYHQKNYDRKKMSSKFNEGGYTLDKQREEKRIAQARSELYLMDLQKIQKQNEIIRRHNNAGTIVQYMAKNGNPKDKRFARSLQHEKLKEQEYR